MDNTNNTESLCLCLSGGGLRATFFHLGVIRALRDCGRLTDVTHICSVSGGSILAAHLALNWTRYTGTYKDFREAEESLLAIASWDIRGRIIRRWLLGITVPLLWVCFPRFRRAKLLEREYSKFYKGATFIDIYNNNKEAPDLYILSTSLTTGNLCAFSKDGFSIQADETHDKPVLYKTKLIPLAFAVAASSAFPPLFPPVVLTRHMLGANAKKLPYDVELLSDGGVFDNLGFEFFKRLKKQDVKTPSNLILSDAGAGFDWDTKRKFSNIITRTVRATDILMKRVADQTLEVIHGIGSAINTISISHEVNERHFFFETLTTDLQKRLSKVRTDLDIFPATVTNLLIKHGYEVCRERLESNSLTKPRSEGQIGSFPIPATATAIIISAVRDLDKSAKRNIGIINFRDWAFYALAGWIACLLFIPFVPPLLVVTNQQEVIVALQADLAQKEERAAAFSRSLNDAQDRNKMLQEDNDRLQSHIDGLQRELSTRRNNDQSGPDRSNSDQSQPDRSNNDQSRPGQPNDQSRRDQPNIDSYEEQFQEFLDMNNVTGFTASELLVDSRIVGPLMLPDQHLWANIIPTVKILQDFMRMTGATIKILSVYRPYIDRYGHNNFNAIDFYVKGMSTEEAKNTILRMRQQGLFSGGLGTGQQGLFRISPDIEGFRTDEVIHLDTRGENVDF